MSDMGSDKVPAPPAASAGAPAPVSAEKRLRKYVNVGGFVAVFLILLCLFNSIMGFTHILFNHRHADTSAFWQGWRDYSWLPQLLSALIVVYFALDHCLFHREGRRTPFPPAWRGLLLGAAITLALSIPLLVQFEWRQRAFAERMIIALVPATLAAALAFEPFAWRGGVRRWVRLIPPMAGLLLIATALIPGIYPDDGSNMPTLFAHMPRNVAGFLVVVGVVGWKLATWENRRFGTIDAAYATLLLATWLAVTLAQMGSLGMINCLCRVIDDAETTAAMTRIAGGAMGIFAMAVVARVALHLRRRRSARA